MVSEFQRENEKLIMGMIDKKRITTAQAERIRKANPYDTKRAAGMLALVWLPEGGKYSDDTLAAAIGQGRRVANGQGPARMQTGQLGEF
jgi:hypothetical protein